MKLRFLVAALCGMFLISGICFGEDPADKENPGAVEKSVSPPSPEDVYAGELRKLCEEYRAEVHSAWENWLTSHRAAREKHWALAALVLKNASEKLLETKLRDAPQKAREVADDVAVKMREEHEFCAESRAAANRELKSALRAAKNKFRAMKRAAEAAYRASRGK